MEAAGHFARSLGGLLSELWVFFLLGFLAAGTVAEFVPRSLLLRYLGRNRPATFVRAALAGVVTSICSCGAIPVAVKLRRGGASRAAALTFLLAAPWAGFMQLLIFYRFLGAGQTAVMFAGAMGVALLTGLVLGRLEDAGWLEGGGGESTPLQRERSSPGAFETPPLNRPTSARLLRVLAEAAQAFRELWKYLAIGLLLASVLKAFVPGEWVSGFLGAGGGVLAVFTAVPVAAVVELCSEGFSVFAGQLFEMGATLAVVFVVVLVGVSTDFTELSVIWGNFGKRSMVAYLLTATTLTLLVALLIHAALAGG